MNHRRFVPTIATFLGAAVISTCGCRALFQPVAPPPAPTAPPSTASGLHATFTGRYVTMTREELEHLVPAYPNNEEALAFERALTDLTTNIPDGGDLKAWSREATDESPFDLLAVLDPDRKNADGTPVRKDQWKAIYPKTCELLANACGELDSLPLKKLHPRVRPHIPDKFESYPSGHTYRAALQAAVLAQVVPEKRRDLVREAVTLGMLRGVIGVHYPTDVWDGFIVGQYVGWKMKENETFGVDLQLAKKEWVNFGK